MALLLIGSLVPLSMAATAQAQGPCDPPAQCTIWSPSQTPGTPAANDPNPLEVGVKFRSASAGYVTAIRFYKGPGNGGTHTAHLWTSTGTLLSVATFIGESASGWQEVALPNAVAIAANTTYVASYHTDSGFYAVDSDYFTSAVVNGPLQALADGFDGGNGVYRYGASAFPNNTFHSSNYWIDVVFLTSLPPDVTPPTIVSTTPGAFAASNAVITAVFSEDLNPATVSTTSFELRDSSGGPIAGSVSYSAATRTATFQPSASLAMLSGFTATVHGGGIGVKDTTGNALAADVSWSFTTAGPPPTSGPGGPILVVTTAGNNFSTYYAEILRAEGLNAFAVADINTVTSGVLGAYDVVILGQMSLTTAQVTMLSDWVIAGGNLIAMRPDKQLASLLGLTDAGTTLQDAYLQVDTSAAPGTGIVSATMQFHGAADLYTVTGATAIASLFTNATTGTPNPAVTVRSVGSAGGQAAAFAYDLARSVVYTRQGNPAWSGQERDGITPIRSDDLYFGGAVANYVDLSKVAIPQADEQQRLLANLIGFVNADRKPLPRFWYLPRRLKAAIVMTGDDHANNGTEGRFDIYNTDSPANCSVADWECVRGTSYIYPTTPISSATATSFVNQGFEIGVHVTTLCNDFTPSSLDATYANDLGQFASHFPALPAPRTNRTHCIAWSDYDTQPQIEFARGIRLDVNYYYWPASWILNVPGVFTGSGLPQRFTKADGTMIDVYQATTQMTDESGQSYPLHSDVLLDRALGPEGYYGTFTTNMHTDTAVHPGSEAIVASAKARGIPIISAEQLLDWTDGRNGSAFRNIAWNGTSLTFSIVAWSHTNGLQAMLPTSSVAGPIAGILRNGTPADMTIDTIKGVTYAFFDATNGSYEARYGADTIPPLISNLSVTPQATSAVVSWHTSELTTARVDYGVSPDALVFSTSQPGVAGSHVLQLTGLAAGTNYYFRVTSVDAGGNSVSAPLPNGTFTTPAMPPLVVSDATTADFAAGTFDAGVYAAETTDGEVLLTPTAGSEFFGTTLPSGWSTVNWSSGGTTTVDGTHLIVDGMRASTDATYGPGRTLEFVATFSGQAFEHIGFGITFNEAPWAIFSTGSGGTLLARTNTGSTSLDTPLPPPFLSGPHRFRIDWTATGVNYTVDGLLVAIHNFAISTPMRPIVSDVNVGGGNVTVDWLRLTPYSTTGTFTSRVLDASSSTQWASMSWDATVPSGTSIAMSARFGDTPVPDGTWTSFVSVPTSGGSVSASSRYVQYRATLNGGTDTPVLQSVSIIAASAPASVSIGDVTVAETDGVANFTLTLSKPVASTVTVGYSTADNSAKAGTDYVATSGTATFAPGATTAVVPVTVIQDALAESSETFFLNLNSITNAWLADPQGVGTILNQPPLSIANAAVTEGNSGTVNANFVVTLAAASPNTVSVDYATSDLTATAGQDYISTSGTLTYPPGTVQRTIVVPVVGDTLNEANETFRVTLSNAVNAPIGTGQATGTINNDDAVVAASVADVTVTEGSGGSNSAIVPVTLSAASGQTVSIGYTTSNGTATTADYTTTTGTLTFPPGTTALNISVPITTDLINEPDETFRVTLRTPVNATIARTTGTVTIANDDALPTVSIGNVSVNEGNTGSVNATFTVTLSNASSSVVTVNWSTADGTAVAGADYTASSGTVTFTAGQTSRTFTVPVLGDTIDEPNETFVVNLNTPVNATIATGQGTATIVDNDATPSIRISDVTVTEPDTGGTVAATLNVTLSNPSSTPITVSYATGTTGTATPSVDFTPVPLTQLTFNPGQTSIPITVTVLGDVINEANETVNVDLSQQSSNATIADSRGVVTIAENDPLPSVTVNDITVTEGNSGTKTATFTFTLSAVSGRNVSVTYATANGTATAPTDYTAKNGTVTITAGTTSATLAITVRGDTTVEPDETVLLNLTGVTNGTLARTQAVLTIANDDQ